MRLKKLTVRNYRVHKDFTLDFHSGLNLIGGDNESGKSTLAEAIHRALFFKYNSGSEPQRLMVSKLYGGDPEVDLEFEAEGANWTLEKKFGGRARGTVRLTSDRNENLTGDAAEERLAELTGNRNTDAVTSMNQLGTRWAHLWIWQGAAGEDASIHTADHKDDLIQRLRQQGVRAVLQSAADERVQKKISTLYSEIFTATGLVGSRSKLALAEKEKAEAEEKVRLAREQLANLDAAIASQQTAEKILQEAKELLPEAREQLAKAETDLQRVNELQAQVEAQEKDYAAKTEELARLIKIDKEIHSLHAQATEARNALQPKEKQGAELAEKAKSAASAAQSAEKNRNSRESELRHARQIYDLAAACVQKIEKTAELEQLGKKSKEIAELEASLREHQAEYAKLPEITETVLGKLRDLHSRTSLAKNRLETIAAGIEIIESDQEILLDGALLEAGEARTITEASELVIGLGIRLRIHPGGGTTLEEARHEFEDNSRELSQRFEGLDVASLEQASEVLVQRQTISQKISDRKTRLSALNARELSDLLADAENAAQSAELALKNCQERLTQPLERPLPSELTEARVFLENALADREKQQQEEDALRRHAEIARELLNEANTAYSEHQVELDEARQKLKELEIRANAHESSAGDSTARLQAISRAEAAKATAKTELEKITANLNELRPEELKSSVLRLQRVIEMQSEKQSEAEKRKAVAANILEQDGTRDPAADLARAIAHQEALVEAHAREKRRADAIKLLHDFFQKSQATFSDSLTTPITEKVGQYLSPIMGNGVAISMDLTGSNDRSFAVKRPSDPEPIPFSLLSGGAKEQVAAALRLAMAEILATQEDGSRGCLPLLFDDAFANADPTRTQAIQIMLDQAARNGLQIIVLSCTPADYKFLGAKETILSIVS